MPTVRDVNQDYTKLTSVYRISFYLQNVDNSVKEQTMIEEQNVKLRKENSWLKNQLLTNLKG
jgi:hypothetical protein